MKNWTWLVGLMLLLPFVLAPVMEARAQSVALGAPGPRLTQQQYRDVIARAEAAREPVAPAGGYDAAQARALGFNTLANAQGVAVPPDEGVDQSRGVFTFMPSRTLLTVGPGGDQISSLPQNLMPAAQTVYEAHWKSGGIDVGVICPRLPGESDQHHAGRFRNDVDALKQVFAPDVTTPSH